VFQEKQKAKKKKKKKQTKKRDLIYLVDVTRRTLSK
jgi:hypothetical protein